MRIRGSGSASPAGAEFLVYRSKLEAGAKKGSSIHASSAYWMQSRHMRYLNLNLGCTASAADLGDLVLRAGRADAH
jgi:hypothetical protein